MKGMPRQMLTAMTAAWACSGTPRKSTLVEISPSFRSDQETIENCGSKIHQKAIAESTVGTMKGIRIIDRTSERNGIFLLSRMARYSPMANLKVLAIAV